MTRKKNHPTRKSTIVLISCVLGLTTASLSCNLYGKLDPPGEQIDQLTAALALANAGDCAGARDLLSGITNPSDEVATALGWAYLCIGGATAGNIASSIYKFTGSANNLTVIGTLAQTLIPMTTAKHTNFDRAVLAFEKIGNGSRRSIEIAIAKFAKASSVLALQAGNNASTGTLTQDDISPVACAAAADDCSAGFAGVCTAGMTDTRVDEFFAAATDAANALSDSGAGELQTLAGALRNGVGGSQDAGRCFIYKKTIAP